MPDDKNGIGETAAQPRVIGLFDRKPFEAATEAAEPGEDPGPRVDEHAIIMLEAIIERVKEGGLYGVAVVALKNGIDCSTFVSDGGQETLLALSGGAAMLNRRILDDMESDDLEFYGEEDGGDGE